jgi:hypothetical protein
MNDEAERSLGRRLDSPEPDAEAGGFFLVEPLAAKPPEAVRLRPPPTPRVGSPAFLTCLAMLLIGAAGVAVFSPEWFQLSIPLAATDDMPKGTAGSSISRRKGADIVQKNQPAATIDDIRRRLEEFKNLEPKELQGSKSFLDANNDKLEVEARYWDRREKVREAYRSLIAIRGLMVGPSTKNSVAYFYYEQGATGRDERSRLHEISAVLKERSLGRKECREVLKLAFLDEFEDSHSEIRRWCDAVERLDDTVARLPNDKGGATPIPTSTRGGPSRAP